MGVQSYVVLLTAAWHQLFMLNKLLAKQLNACNLQIGFAAIFGALFQL